MKTIINSLIVVFILESCSLFASQWSISGYLECDLELAKFSEYQYYGYNKIRFDFLKPINSQIGIHNSILAKQYWGKSNFEFSELFPVDPLNNLPNISLTDTLYFDNLFLVWRTKKLGDLVVGKQPITIGEGYVWNPTDIFSVKDNIDPTYELQGVNGFRWLFSTKYFDIDGIIQPQNDGKNINAYFGISNLSGHFENTLSLIRRTYHSGAQNYLTDKSIGISTVGEIFTAGTWVEANWVFSGQMFPDNYEIAIGADYTTTSSLHIMLEAYHNDAGENHQTSDYYSDSQVLLYINGDTRSLGEDYFILLADYPVADWWNLSFWTLNNMTDRSRIIAFEITGNPFQDTTVHLSIYSFMGSNNTEFGMYENGLRVKYDFYF